jgi:hypothetical protein
MAKCIRNRKTEHTGAKHGKGAFYGRKVWAKDASNGERRRISHELENWYPEGVDRGSARV